MKARLGLRDLWDNTNAPAPKAVKTLSELLGYKVDIDLDATKLWSDLQKHYTDPEDFAPTVAFIVQTWADCFSARLQDESNATWTEKLLEVVTEGKSVVQARVVVSAASVEQCFLILLAKSIDMLKPQAGALVKTSWSEAGGEFIIGVPECPPASISDDPQSTIAQSLQQLFGDAEPGMSKSTLKAEDNDWAAVDLPSREKNSTKAMPTKLPSAQSLARPDILFASQVPYHMIVTIMHDGIIVMGSHQPSLQLLKDYFEKYARVDQNRSDKTRILKIELQRSLFGYGNLFDSLKIEPFNPRATWDPINPVFILSFIENVLAYRMLLELSTGSQWQFRRDVAFK
ncbi:MAG: hypothetical protein Q9218_001723 [Villophora microphyllina]